LKTVVISPEVTEFIEQVEYVLRPILCH